MRGATMAAMTATTDALPFTGDDEADRLLVAEPLAMLIGFALDQQVTVQKAFSGPLELKRRVGHLDAARLAATDPTELDEVFRRPPALHRFPGSMAAKVQALAGAIATDYGGDAERIWTEATDGKDLRRRLLDLPGLAAELPLHPTLGDVDSAEALATYQAGKRARKAELRAARG